VDTFCYIVQNSTYNESTGRYTLPSQADVETEVAHLTFGRSMTKEGIDDVYGTVSAASRGQIVKAYADGGCTGKFFGDAS